MAQGVYSIKNQINGKVGDRAMTQLERDQKYRINHPEKYKQIHRKGKK